MNIEPGAVSTRVAAVLLLVLAACSGDRPAPGAETFTDDLGRQVPLPDTVERVVTLAPSLTEIVFAAGAGHRLVSAGVPDDYPPALDTLPRHSVYPVDFEAIAARRPDLVLASDVNNPRDAETFAALGIPVVFFAFSSLEDVPRTIRTVGDLLGTEAAAQAAADSLERAAARLRARTQSVDERPDVLFLIGDDVLYAFGSESYMHELIKLAGGRSVTGELDVETPVLTDEFVLTHAPDVIVGPWGPGYDASDLLAKHPTWDVVPAVRTGRVYGVEPDLFLRGGPRLYAGAARLARILHPDLSGGNPSTAEASAKP